MAKLVLQHLLPPHFCFTTAAGGIPSHATLHSALPQTPVESLRLVQLYTPPYSIKSSQFSPVCRSTAAPTQIHYGTWKVSSPIGDTNDGLIFIINNNKNCDLDMSIETIRNVHSHSLRCRTSSNMRINMWYGNRTLSSTLEADRSKQWLRQSKRELLVE